SCCAARRSSHRQQRRSRRTVGSDSLLPEAAPSSAVFSPFFALHTARNRDAPPGGGPRGTVIFDPFLANIRPKRQPSCGSAPRRCGKLPRPLLRLGGGRSRWSCGGDEGSRGDQTIEPRRRAAPLRRHMAVVDPLLVRGLVGQTLLED